MSTPADRLPLEDQIGQWRQYVRRRRTISGPDVDELEAHLRDQVGALTEGGLAADEAFLVAVKRLGNLDALSREFAREHSDRLWKQLVIGAEPAEGPAETKRRAETIAVLILAASAALAIKVPALFGLQLHGQGAPFYARNASLFVLPQLAGYFAWQRRLEGSRDLWLALSFVAAAVCANIFPFKASSHTEILTALHLPMALWLAVGVAYAGGRWFAAGRRMDFVRFSGELAVYYALIAFGGGVLTALTMMMFNAIGLNASWLAQDWLIPCGAMGAVIVGSWLVEAKQSVIENMAPVLTRLFTPLFTAVLLVFLGTMASTGRPIDIEREVLIGFDLLLAVVTGLVLYATSARDQMSPPDWFDRMQLLLVVSALIVDTLALAAIVTRISQFGFTPNRVAALGENLILLISLVGSAWLNARFIRHRGTFAELEWWQMSYLPVYSAWAAFVVIAFPPIFHYR
jgi:hypothetical protein